MKGAAVAAWGSATLAASLLGACADGRAVRIVAGRSDTVVVNSRQAVALDVRLVSASGQTRPARNVDLKLLRGDLDLVGNEAVRCSVAGDAALTVSRGDVSTTITVLCRPIAGFRVPRVMHLTVGGRPVPLEVGAVGENREPVALVAGRLSVRDSLVATVNDGLVYPKGRGATTIEVEAGDCAMSILIEVVEPAQNASDLLPHQYFAESLSVSPGEIRNWRLPAGRYEIRLLDDEGAPENLRLASHEMNCAPFPRMEQQYMCIARERAAVIVHHTRAADGGRDAISTLLINRLGDSIREPGWRRRSEVYPCPFVGH